jgi:hypothetical protein
MFETLIGRFVGGALWGLGAGVVLTVVKGGVPGIRPAAKTAVTAYLVVAEKLQEATAEARESFEDLYAEAHHEHRQAAANNGQRASSASHAEA